MVLDTSAFVAILYHEPERDDFLLRIETEKKALVSTVSLVELEMVLSRTGGASAIAMVDDFLQLFAIQPIPFDLEQSILAREAFLRFGKGRHPAALNFGDCITYALAKQTGEPVLCKGNDFIRTDITLA